MVGARRGALVEQPRVPTIEIETIIENNRSVTAGLDWSPDTLLKSELKTVSSPPFFPLPCGGYSLTLGVRDITFLELWCFAPCGLSYKAPVAS